MAAATAALFEGLTFPEKLMYVLDNQIAPAAIWWLPGDRTFAICPEKFQSQVLDEYFQQTKVMSFVRKLNQWGFRRIPRQIKTDNAMNFVHARFRKGSPELLAGISDRKKAKSAKGKKKDSAADTSSPTSLSKPRATAALQGIDSASLSAHPMSNLAKPQAIPAREWPAMEVLSGIAPGPFTRTSIPRPPTMCATTGPVASLTPPSVPSATAAAPSLASNLNQHTYNSLLVQAALSALSKPVVAPHNAETQTAAPQTITQQTQTTLAQQIAQASALQQLLTQQSQPMPSPILAAIQPQYLSSATIASSVAEAATSGGDANNPILDLLRMLGSTTGASQNPAP